MFPLYAKVLPVDDLDQELNIDALIHVGRSLFAYIR